MFNPLVTDRYAALKDRLIKSFMNSAEKKLYKLLNEVDISDCRLLQLFRRMRVLAQNGVRGSA